MAIIHVDGKQFEVKGGDNLLQTCLSLGLDIPYFCWHPALDSVGACRQCAVKQYKDGDDKQGRIVMSCMTPTTDNTWISIDDEESKEFRETIISFLMTNHPHDCPVCEEGGHCHLQDMTVMTGHHNREYRFTKRTHRNQDLGPFIAHEMNRCISCYRCTRFYNDYAGGTDLGVYGSAANVYFGREKDGTLENEFSGNLTEVCPTGVFTDKTHSERYTRKWDMQFSPSICASCSVGCNISPGERYGEVRRVENRYHAELNGYFLCDRGRFGYGHVNRKDRPRQLLVSKDGRREAMDGGDALEFIRQQLKAGKPVLGIGSPRASIESNYALRELVGAANFSNGQSALDAALARLCLDVMQKGTAPCATPASVEEADAVLVLGEDVLATAPRIALALRQAAKGKADTLCAEKKVPDWQAASAKDIAQRQLNPVFVATPAKTRFDDVAVATHRAAAPDLARLGYAIAHALDASSPAVEGLDAKTTELAQRIAATLKAAKRPLVISGTGCGDAAVIQAAANIAWALQASHPGAEICLAVPESNSIGLALFDAADLEAMLARAAAEPSVLVVVENDLYARLPAAQVDAALAKATLIVLEHQETRTAQRAQALLPAASFAEGDGTLVNYEGRAQRYFQNFDPAYYDRSVAIAESWRWLDRLQNGDAAQENLDDVLAQAEAALPALKGIAAAAPNASFRIKGMKVARAPQRQSGRTAARANIFVHEPRSTQDADSALAFSMEGVNGSHGIDRPPELLPFAWAPGWNSPQAWNKFQAEVGGSLRGGDSGVHLFKAGASRPAYYAAVPAAFKPNGALRVEPLYQHFGSEELSSRAAPIQERIPATYAALNVGDAARLGVNHAELVSITLDGQTFSLPARVRPDLPAGVLGLPVGLAGVPPLKAGSAATVAKGA
ncbi:NADH-quinone oxidoreductase subunit NuoG [Solimonas sp. SE-A11]|uniref:NADH-quinone oxidoreductase subunit NuoG n=1 Tax=Solimonas sp. SE-A11 TaxID=3054954 RepID=UPI00259CA714|nr:NADH-quinone oxidoreductase subunit NuoG [Solimonas sp. SE-A11]MDM4771353.1 NADH-quinone oxidoreductase subunit NuoG [Solimonas sp. SE-A11]